MFAPFIKNNLSFINDYFSLLLTSHKAANTQSIILYGEDSFAQYMLALNIAKILNCQTKKFSCQCLNCNWISTNTHPAVITVSKNDFKPEDDGSKTVISVKQTLAIKNALASTSEYHRIFILCDSEIKAPSQKERELIRKFKENQFTLPIEDKENDIYWIPKGITRKVFQEESANSLLKSIEEPPPNTTFIFLTKDKSDLIETIISRSQCFYVPSQYSENNDTELISRELPYYPEVDRLRINEIANNLLSNADALNMSPEELLTKFQSYIKQKAIQNQNKPYLVTKMIEDIKTLNSTQAQIRSYIKPQSALENALFLIYKNHQN